MICRVLRIVIAPALWILAGIALAGMEPSPESGSPVSESYPGIPAHAVTDKYGAIIRMDTTRKQVYLVFSADTYGEGVGPVLDLLWRKKVNASFFLTGNFLRNPDFREVTQRIIREGHYLGAHSDRHLLYNAWEKRDSLLVTRRQFRKDLLRNLAEIRRAGGNPALAGYFLPPFEWYNSLICQWAVQVGRQVVNFTPGTGTQADYTTPDMPNYKTSEEIKTGLFRFEKSSSSGLNGAILLVHPGTHPDRTDKLYNQLEDVMDKLIEAGYSFHRL